MFFGAQRSGSGSGAGRQASVPRLRHHGGKRVEVPQHRVGELTQRRQLASRDAIGVMGGVVSDEANLVGPFADRSGHVASRDGCFDRRFQVGALVSSLSKGLLKSPAIHNSGGLLAVRQGEVRLGLKQRPINFCWKMLGPIGMAKLGPHLKYKNICGSNISIVLTACKREFLKSRPGYRLTCSDSSDNRHNASSTCGGNNAVLPRFISFYKRIRWCSASEDIKGLHVGEAMRAFYYEGGHG
jgi:hypothetical protein